MRPGNAIAALLRETYLLMFGDWDENSWVRKRITTLSSSVWNALSTRCSAPGRTCPTTYDATVSRGWDSRTVSDGVRGRGLAIRGGVMPSAGETGIAPMSGFHLLNQQITILPERVVRRITGPGAMKKTNDGAKMTTGCRAFGTSRFPFWRN